MAYDFSTNKSLTNGTAPVTQEPMTIACWFYNRSTTTRTVIVSITDTAAGTTSPFFALVEDGTKAGDPICATKLSVGTDAGEAVSTSGFTANKWHHGCAVFTSTTSRTVYLDGGSSATNTTNRPADTQVVDKTAIGCLGRATNVAFFNGLIAEVGIWNTDLTAAEAASLAQGVSPSLIRPQSLVFYAPLIRELIDQSGGLVLTNNNTATVANHPRIYA